MEPTRPKPRPARPPKPPEDRKVPGNNNVSLLIIAVIVCVALAAIFLPYGSSVVIKFGHLEQLIEKGAPSEKNKDPYIDVTETHSGRELTVRYSNLSDVQVGPNEITGKVTREVLAPDDAARQPKEDVAFTCSRYGLDQDNGKLQHELATRVFVVEGGSPPSPWRNYLMLVGADRGRACDRRPAAPPTGRGKFGHGLRPQSRQVAGPGRHRGDVRRSGRHR